MDAAAFLEGKETWNPEQEAVEFFKSNGWEPHHAAGIAGNLSHESAGMQTTALGDSNKSFGLGQWNGDRREKLFEYAKSKGEQVPSFRTQLEFVQKELTGSEAKAGNALRTAKNVDEATRIFSEAYERPGKPLMDSRLTKARSISMGGMSAEDFLSAGEKPSTWEHVSSYPRGFISGVMSNVAAVPESLSIGPYAEQADIAKGGTPSGSGRTFMTEQGRMVTAEQIERAKEYLKTAPTPEQGLGYKIGQAVKPSEEKISPEVKSSLGYNAAKVVGQGIGQAGQYLAMRRAGIGVVPAMGSSTSQSMALEESDMYRRGRDQGIDPATSAIAATEAQKLGWLDTAGAAPLLEGLIRYTPGPAKAAAGNVVSKLIQLAAKYPRTAGGIATAAEELATEIPQGLLEDKIAGKHFNEATDAWETVKDTAAVTSIGSFMLGTFLTAMGIRAKTGKWKLPKEGAATQITEGQPAVESTPPTVEAPSPAQAEPNLFQADTSEFARLVGGLEFQKKTEAQKFISEMKELRPQLELEITGKEIETKQGTKKVIAPYTIAVKNVSEFNVDQAMEQEPVETPVGPGIPPSQVIEPSYVAPETTRVEGEKPSPLTPLQTQVSETPRTPPPVPSHPIQGYMKQEHESLQFANLYAAKAKRETGIQLYPVETENGWVLRMARKSVYPVNTVGESIAEPSKATPEQLREQVITPEGKTQAQVDNDMVAQMRAELAARQEDRPAEEPSPTKTIRDVTQEILGAPSGRVESPTIPTIPTQEVDPIIEGAPKGTAAKKLYLKRLGPSARGYEVSKSGEIVKLYSFDPFSYSSDNMWASKMAMSVGKDITNWPKVVDKNYFTTRMEKMASAGLFKKEEWEDTVRMTGLKQWMDKWPGGKVPREQVLEWIVGNGIQVEETQYPIEDREAKHETYSLPGGSNYTELVLWSPQAQELGEDPVHFAEGEGRKNIGWIRGKEFTDSQGRRIFNIEEVQSNRHQEGRKSGYLDSTEEIRILAEIQKLQTKLDELNLELANAEKKRVTLITQYIDEAWANRIDVSFINGRENLISLQEKAREDSGFNLVADQIRRVQTDLDLLRLSDKAPDAPFRKSWTTLLLRRALKYAAEKGYDGVSWTTGEQQNTRYSLGRSVDEITTQKSNSGFYYVIGYKSGTEVVNTEVPADALSNYVGGELADKIVKFHEANPNTGSRLPHSSFRCLDLDVNGQGMKSFYGSMSPEGQFSPGIFSSAMKDAVKPFKAKEEIVKDLYRGREGKLGVVKESSVTNFSLQPAIILTPEMKDSFSNQPMMMYSLDPFAWLNKKNPMQVKSSILSGQPGDQLGKITEGYVDDTVGWLQKYISQSQWVVKGNSTLEPIFRRVLDKQADFLTSFDQSLRGLDGFRKLKTADKKLLGQVAWNVEGKDYEGQGITENKYTKDGELIELNPAHYEQYKAWAKTQLPDDMAIALTDLRMSLDQDLANKWNRATKSKRFSNAIMAELRKEVYDIPNYLPHSRYGDFVLEGYAKDDKGNEVKVYDGAFDLSTMPGIKELNKKRFRRMVEGIVPTLEKSDQIKDLGITRWNVAIRPSIPSDMFENQPVLVKALDEVINTASKRLGPELSGAIQNALPKAVADVMKSRGDWGHFARRRGIPGYETEDLGKVLYDYKAGLYGLLSKADAAHDLSNMMYSLDKNKPNEFQWATQFVKDALAPRSKIDDAAGTIKALGFLKYISGSLKTPLVNLSNMVNQGVPTLAQYVGPKADMYLVKALPKTASILRGNVGNHTAGEVRLIQELYSDGTLQAQYVKEVKRDIGRGTGFDSKLGWMFDKLAFPMELSEQYSRASTAIAAYNAALEGKVDRPDLGLKKGQAMRDPSEEQFQSLKRFAEEITNESHSIFGKINRPSFARSGGMGSAVSSMYLFRHFTQNLLHLWASMGKKAMRGDYNAAYGLVRGIAGNILLGGMSGIPLIAAFRKMYRDWLPKEAKVLGDDPYLEAKKSMPDWAFYGLPALAGVSVGGSVSVDTPDNFEELLGVPVSIAKDIVRGKSAYETGDYSKMAEAILFPKVLTDFLKASRMHTIGQTTLTGRPVNLPGEVGPRKITKEEAYKQVLGFTPLSSQKAWDIREGIQGVEDLRKDKQSGLANRWAVARLHNDPAAMQQVVAELRDWNLYWIEQNKPHYIIDIKKALVERMLAEQPSKRAMGLALETKEAFKE